MNTNSEIYLIGLAILFFLIIVFLFIRKISNSNELKVNIEDIDRSDTSDPVTDNSNHHNFNLKVWFIEVLNNLGFKAYKTQANFVFVIIPEYKNQNAKKINDYLLSKGIALRYLSTYGIDNALRITLGTKEELNQTLELLKEFKKKNE